jgi:hypothetical protein
MKILLRCKLRLEFFALRSMLTFLARALNVPDTTSESRRDGCNIRSYGFVTRLALMVMKHFSML